MVHKILNVHFSPRRKGWPNLICRYALNVYTTVLYMSYYFYQWKIGKGLRILIPLLEFLFLGLQKRFFVNPGNFGIFSCWLKRRKKISNLIGWHIRFPVKSINCMYYNHGVCMLIWFGSCHHWQLAATLRLLQLLLVVSVMGPGSSSRVAVKL